jgi:hypothetical protein
MGKLVHLTNVSLDLLIENEHGSLDLTADFAGARAAATRRTSR